MLGRVARLLFLLIAGLAFSTAWSEPVSAIPVIVATSENPPDYIQAPVEAFVHDGRTMIPLTSLTPTLGSEYCWDPYSQVITLRRGAISIDMAIDDPVVYINDKAREIDVPAQLADGIPFVPMAFVAISLGYNVKYVEYAWGEGPMVYITSFRMIDNYKESELKYTSFVESTDEKGTVYSLRPQAKSAQGISLGATTRQVLEAYGTPFAISPSTHDMKNYSGVVSYTGVFLPKRQEGTKYLFSFEKGLLINMQIVG